MNEELENQIKEQIEKVEKLEKIADDFRLEAESLYYSAQSKEKEYGEAEEEAEKEDKILNTKLQEWESVTGSTWYKVDIEAQRQWKRDNEDTVEI